MKTYSEAAFETAIKEYLITHGGYENGDPNAFDRTHCLDTGVLIAFIKETQPKEWEYLTSILGRKVEKTLTEDLRQAAMPNPMENFGYKSPLCPGEYLH